MCSPHVVESLWHFFHVNFVLPLNINDWYFSLEFNGFRCFNRYNVIDSFGHISGDRSYFLLDLNEVVFNRYSLGLFSLFQNWLFDDVLNGEWNLLLLVNDDWVLNSDLLGLIDDFNLNVLNNDFLVFGVVFPVWFFNNAINVEGLGGHSRFEHLGLLNNFIVFKSASFGLGSLPSLNFDIFNVNGLVVSDWSWYWDLNESFNVVVNDLLCGHGSGDLDNLRHNDINVDLFAHGNWYLNFPDDLTWDSYLLLLKTGLLNDTLNNVLLWNISEVLMRYLNDVFDLEGNISFNDILDRYLDKSFDVVSFCGLTNFFLWALNDVIDVVRNSCLNNTLNWHFNDSFNSLRYVNDVFNGLNPLDNLFYFDKPLNRFLNVDWNLLYWYFNIHTLTVLGLTNLANRDMLSLAVADIALVAIVSGLGNLVAG